MLENAAAIPEAHSMQPPAVNGRSGPTPRTRSERGLRRGTLPKCERRSPIKLANLWISRALSEHHSHLGSLRYERHVVDAHLGAGTCIDGEADPRLVVR